MSTSVIAADLEVKAIPVVIPPNWTGPSIGGFGTFTFNNGGSQPTKNLGCTIGTVGGPISSCVGAVTSTGGTGAPPDGFSGGIQAAYDFQAIHSFMVWGVVADFTWMDKQVDKLVSTTWPVGIGPPPSPFVETTTAALSHRLLWLSTARLRFGPTWERLYAYVTGGLAFGQVNSSASTVHTGVNNPPSTVCLAASCVLASGSGSDSGIQFGYTVGAGLQFALTPRLTLGAEYLYYDLGTRSYTVQVNYDPILFGPGGAYSYVVDSTARGHMFKLGLNWLFNPLIR